MTKTVEKQSIQVFRKISNLIENQSRSTKTNTKQEIYKNKEDMQKSSEAKRSKQQTFDEEDNYQKKTKRRKSVIFEHHQSVCEQLTSHSVNMKPLFLNKKAQPNVQNFRNQK